MADALAILRRHERMKSQRANAVETVWRDCMDYTFPLRGNGLNGAVETANAGQAKQARILDSTAADAVLVLAANIMSGLTPANAEWFALDVGNETADERRWLDGAAKLLWENIHIANFDAEAFECCVDLVGAGDFALFTDEDRERGGLSFQHWSLASVYASSTRADGRIDVVHREYTLTAEQAASEFGEDKLPERVRKDAEKRPDEPHVFVHAIYPRTPHAVGAKLAKNLPFASCHLHLESKMEVRESGYHEFPVAYPRWMRVPGSLYGVGPVYQALPDIRQLNELKRMELDSADMAISGMWAVADDGVFNARTTKIGPRKLLVLADVNNIKPLTSGANFELSDVMVSKLQASIRKVLMADQLQPQDGPDMTATEVHVRVEMIRKLLGPIYGRLQAEYLTSVVERCFGLAYRAGIFEPAPESLQGRAFSVRYVSPMARAQRLDDVVAMDRFELSMVQAAQAKPEVIDAYDWVAATKERSYLLGVPQKLLNDDKRMAEIEADRQQKQQQAVQQQVMAQGAAAAAEEGGKKLGAVAA